MIPGGHYLLETSRAYLTEAVADDLALDMKASISVRRSARLSTRATSRCPVAACGTAGVVRPAASPSSSSTEAQDRRTTTCARSKRSQMSVRSCSTDQLGSGRSDRPAIGGCGSLSGSYRKLGQLEDAPTSLRRFSSATPGERCWATEVRSLPPTLGVRAGAGEAVPRGMKRVVEDMERLKDVACQTSCAA